jgi:hypothetical protein
MPDTYMQYNDEDRGIMARWWGGAYIEFGYVNEMSGGEWVACDVINVYDYAEGKTSIPFTPEAMAEAIEEHLKDDEDEEDEDDDDDGVDNEPSPDPNWMNP